MSLEKEINDRRKEIRTDDMSMSIGEWQSLYENEEIDIHPEFQRIYRWTSTQKSNLIESILLGIPIPPIFVSQKQDGIWDVIDGLQRLSTIYEFMGILRDEENNYKPPLILERTKYLQSLEGKKWKDFEHPHNSLTQEQRLLIKRARLSVNIVLRESDEKAKYELFQRLNTGGSHLTSQEVRNCILVMIDKDAYNWLKKISEYPNFQNAISLTDKNINEQYDIELALRFIIFSNIDEDEFNKVKDVGEFITEKMVEIFTKSFDYESYERQFKSTFDHIMEAVGENSFRRYTENGFKGGFLLTPYEVIAFGLGHNYPNFPNSQKTFEKVKNLNYYQDFQKFSGSGVRADYRLPNLIPLGRKIFSPDED